MSDTKREDLTIRLGETVEFEFTMLDEDGDPVDLSGYTLTSVCLPYIGATTPTWSLTEGDGITVTDETGVVKLTIELATNMTVRFGCYVVKAEDAAHNKSYTKEGQVRIIPVPVVAT